ncbi:hypothetical protein [Streptomyces sp. NPDC002057]|uniref:hypothetical protein n=1 Tax=Streptomyces sp. NPDC002057 TaxID=3154664 RepID=UPI00332A65FB
MAVETRAPDDPLAGGAATGRAVPTRGDRAPYGAPPRRGACRAVPSAAGPHPPRARLRLRPVPISRSSH